MAVGGSGGVDGLELEVEAEADADAAAAEAVAAWANTSCCNGTI